MGFEPIRVDDAAGCAIGAMVAWVDEMHASGAACSDGTNASVWRASKSGLKIADVVSPRPNEDHAPELVAVRAAEIARASLELASDGDAPAPRAPATRPPPAWRNTVPEWGTDTAVDAKLPKKPVARPRTPLLTMGAGAGILMGADVSAVGLDAEVGLRLTRHVALSARSTTSFAGTKVAAPHGSSVDVAPSVFGVGPTFALTAADAFIIPRAGGGVGVVWLRSSPTSSSPGLATGNAIPMGTSSVTSPMTYLNASASIRIAKALRVTFEGLVGTTAHRLVVRAEGEHVAYWGQPFGAFGTRAELMFP